MSAYFFIVQREDVLAWLKKVAPVSVQKRMTLVSDNLKYALGGYFKAQFKIMGVVFFDFSGRTWIYGHRIFCSCGIFDLIS